MILKLFRGHSDGWWYDKKGRHCNISVCPNGLAVWFDIPKKVQEIEVHMTKKKLGMNSIQARISHGEWGNVRLNLFSEKSRWVKTSTMPFAVRFCNREFGKEKFWITLQYRDKK